MNKAEVLSVIVNQQKMGEVCYADNELTFSYATEWLESPEAYPLSVSMTLVKSSHSHNTVEAYLWGLLPDNETVLNEWAKKFHVSPRNVFRLLEHVGQDCAGAIQFIPAAREHELMENSAAEQVQWLDQHELAQRVEAVLKNNGVQRVATDEGQFSLAGAQPKIALYQSPTTGKWGVPSGLTPTTHILKPAIKDLDGIAENEHFCLQLATKLGITTTDSRVIHAGSTPVIVLKRYDRFFLEGRYYRIHQEDFCQALTVMPHRKYQSQGGPSVEDIANTIWEYSSDAYEDINTFAEAIILNYLIVGTDAHAKNYSLLFAGSGQVALTPIYDIASLMPFTDRYNPHKAKLAMKLGSEYHFKKIELRHWLLLAKQLRLNPDDLLGKLKTMTAEIQPAAAATAALLNSQGLTHPIIQTLSECISKRASDIQAQYFSA